MDHNCPKNGKLSFSNIFFRNKYECNLCGTSFHRRDTLLCHTKIFHEEDKGNFNINKDFSAEPSLTKFEREKLLKKRISFHCKICKFGFDSKLDLKNHMKSVHHTKFTRKDPRSCIKQSLERCRNCPGCLQDDCGKCKSCLDKPKFGGKANYRGIHKSKKQNVSLHKFSVT